MSTLATRLAGDGLVLSNSVTALEGARAAVLHAPDLFRLDVAVSGESMRVVVRNMRPGPIAYTDSGYAHPVVVQGDTATLARVRPGHHQLWFRLGEPGHVVEARVIIATLQAVDNGLVRITGQATVRRCESCR